MMGRGRADRAQDENVPSWKYGSRALSRHVMGRVHQTITSGGRRLATDRSEGPATHQILISFTIIGLCFYLLGIRRDLPFLYEIDEPYFVEPAVRIAASGYPNPGWFGHPGSTVIYPLALLTSLWNTLAHGGGLLPPEPALEATFRLNIGEFYLLGRLLTVAYATASIPLTYLVGQRIFGRQVGLIGAWLSLTLPIIAWHAQMVRTDTAALFFGLLGLWLCVRAYDGPTLRNQLVAGLVIGLAVATRYFMVALIPILLMLNGLAWWRETPRSSAVRGVLLRMGAGLAAVVAGFALSTPFFFLDHPNVWSSLQAEAEPSHLGADGFLPWDNFLWYLVESLPRSLTRPVATLAAVGIALALWRRQPSQLMLVGFTVVFLVTISISALHWHRWTIQILPVFALFAADALCATVAALSARLNWPATLRRGVLVAVIAILSMQPVLELIKADVRQMRPSTRILARGWLMQNVSANSRIYQEEFCAPLAGTPLSAAQRFSLAEGGAVDNYYALGYRYLVVSEAVYGHYFAQPDRYPAEVAFYQELFVAGELLRQFDGSSYRDGPTIRIYRLREP